MKKYCRIDRSIFGALGCVALSFFFSDFGTLRAAEQQSERIELSTGEKVDYLIYRPDGDSKEKPPLLLFLHGGGEGGDDLEKVKKNGPPREIEDGRDYPMIVVSPLNPDPRGFWDEDRLARYLEALEKEIDFDKNRLYLAGMSRGAYGAYRLAMENPDRFAAMIVLCGAAPSPYAKWLGDLPTWIIHGEKDTAIPVSESIRMEEAIREAGGNVRLTIHPDLGHDVWTDTFQNPETVEWLLTHRRGPAPDFRNALLSFAEEQSRRKLDGEGIQQFSVAFPDGAAVHAEIVQKAYIIRLLDGLAPAGIKGAVVGKGGQDRFGIANPLSAVLLPGRWHSVREYPQITIREGENPGIETELGILLAKPIDKKLASVDELKEHVRSIVPVIELPAMKSDWTEKPKAADLIAANVGSDHFIVGEEYSDLDIDLDALPIRLFKSEEILNETTGGDAHRGQWWNFLHQVNWAIGQGYELEPGNLVITGALGEIRKDGSGIYRATFGELGEIQFSLK